MDESKSFIEFRHKEIKFQNVYFSAAYLSLKEQRGNIGLLTVRDAAMPLKLPTAVRYKFADWDVSIQAFL